MRQTMLRIRRGGDDSHPTCWSCDGAPVISGGHRRNWGHFKDASDVEAALSTWSFWMAEGVNRGRVLENRVPTMDCFCSRTDCMFEMVRKWRQEKAKRLYALARSASLAERWK